MGLHLPGSAFVHPHSDLRYAMTTKTVHQAVAINRRSDNPRPLGKLLDERSFINAIIGLHATGGSTNHTLHLPAMAAAAGIDLRWEDFAELSEIIPLLARVYPNGKADVNQFHAAGGIGFVMRTLLEEGLLDGSAASIYGDNLADCAVEPILSGNDISWRAAAETSADDDILRPASRPHAKNGGLKMLSGNMGRAVIKISAVDESRHIISAPAAVFENEASVKEAFADGVLNRDCIVVVRAQGPRACGMPELHSLTPLLSTLQDKGFKVALVTDGRMSGASGNVPAAIHLCPEAVAGGPIAQIADGDIITLDAVSGELRVDADLTARPVKTDFVLNTGGFGRPLMAGMRQQAGDAEQGGGVCPQPYDRGRSMNIYDIVAAGQVMPVIVIDKASDAPALGNALLEGGIKTAEVTLRTPQALAAIEAMATSCPELMVGAGTVLNAEHARQVRDAGGCFAVSPGATDALIQGCADVDLPLLPGASSVSEVMRLGEKGFLC